LGADNNISGRLFSSAITTAVNTLITAPNCDFIPPVIQGTNFASWALLPWGTHDLVINYSDIDSWINISSDIIALYKWNWITWWVDISATWLNLWSKVITWISSTYPTNNLGFWKYKYDFHIHDNSRNGSSIWTVFYIDDPEMIVSTWSLDIGLLSTGELIISPWEIIITVKTVWAWFDLILNKTSEMDEINWIEMIDWNWVTWIWYDTDPYSSSINTINTNEILVSNNLNVNINWEKNIHIYKLKIWSLIDYEQAAWIYQASLDIGISLTY
jgi:hypothetical protein